MGGGGRGYLLVQAISIRWTHVRHFLIRVSFPPEEVCPQVANVCWMSALRISSWQLGSTVGPSAQSPRAILCSFFSIVRVSKKKKFYFEVSVCLPLWDSLCTSQRYFFQFVLQLCAEILVKKIIRRGDFFCTHADSKKKYITNNIHTNGAQNGPPMMNRGHRSARALSPHKLCHRPPTDHTTPPLAAAHSLSCPPSPSRTGCSALMPHPRRPPA